MSRGSAGIHHLALYTHDIGETLRFYRVVLGLEGSDVAGSPRGRYAFVHLEAKDSGRRGLHFWEGDKLPRPDLEDHLASFKSGPVRLAHVALRHRMRQPRLPFGLISRARTLR